MKKHLIADRLALPRLPYRLVTDNWWLEDNDRPPEQPPSLRTMQQVCEGVSNYSHEVVACN